MLFEPAYRLQQESRDCQSLHVCGWSDICMRAFPRFHYYRGQLLWTLSIPKQSSRLSLNYRCQSSVVTAAYV
jgi:hypothetical protein